MRLADMCSHTLVKNGVDFIEPCLRQVAPWMKQCFIIIDSRSTDGTIDVINKLALEFGNFKICFAQIGENWQRDLTSALNRQLCETGTKWFICIDDDEFWPNSELEKLNNLLLLDNLEENSYAFRFYYLVDEKHTYNVKGWKGHLTRVFRNKSNLQWRGDFPYTAIYDGKYNLWRQKRVIRSDIYYIHFSLLKKSSWRKDMNQVQDLVLHKRPELMDEVPEQVYQEIKKVLYT